jgi:two-component system, sensor histidine kinase and response regulator
MSSPRPNVLIVDDREANLLALESQLEDMDCEIVRASGGNEALKQLLKREFAVMLLDVQMPDMDGYEVARLSRENPVTRDVPIIFVTATHDTAENALRGYGTGAVDYLFKPVNPHILRGKVRVFLALSRQRKQLVDAIRAHEETLAALELSNDALRHFTHAASHDLGAPLRAVSGFLEALEEEIGQELGPEPRDYLDRSLQAAARMRSLLDGLLVYAGLMRSVRWTEVACAEVVADVRADLDARVSASGGRIEVSELPTVTGDRDRLYQLFLNLVSNALKFHRAGEAPYVRISVQERDGERVFHVDDRGLGIAPEQREKVFEAFERLHGESLYQGTGLGLAICRQIVEQHCGRIWVESSPEGGSRFCFTLGSRTPS